MKKFNIYRHRCVKWRFWADLIRSDQIFKEFWADLIRSDQIWSDSVADESVYYSPIIPHFQKKRALARWRKRPHFSHLKIIVFFSTSRRGRRDPDPDPKKNRVIRARSPYKPRASRPDSLDFLGPERPGTQPPVAEKIVIFLVTKMRSILPP